MHCTRRRLQRRRQDGTKTFDHNVCVEYIAHKTDIDAFAVKSTHTSICAQPNVSAMHSHAECDKTASYTIYTLHTWDVCAFACACATERLVHTFFGWRVYYVGGDLDNEHILRTARIVYKLRISCSSILNLLLAMAEWIVWMMFRLNSWKLYGTWCEAEQYVWNFVTTASHPSSSHYGVFLICGHDR